MRRSSVILLPALVAANAIQAQQARFPAIDSVITQEMRVRRIPGVAVAVVEDGKFLYKRAFGTANLETGTPLTPDAVFELASITKQFTAAGIMMLVEEGKVRLDDLISSYIDNTPPIWARITVRHLLTHSAGLRASGVVRVQESALLNISTKSAFDYIAQQPMFFQPGEQSFYNDAGYFLLGMIIEKASGQTYRQFVQKRIFDPLQMSTSSITDRARVLKGRVPTYGIRDSVWVNWRRDWDYELPSFFGIHSTLDDLVKWDLSLRNATLLKPASLAQMWTPAKLDNGQYARVLDQFYGFGFGLDDMRGARTVGHGGASGTYILRFVDQPLTIIVLTNLEVLNSRHPVLLAQSVAGALRPQFLPPHMLAASKDPTAQVTRDVQTLLADIAANRESSVMSPAYLEWYRTAIGYRAFSSRLLQGAGPLTYLASDDMTGRATWDTQPLDRIVYYKASVGGNPFFFAAGLEDGKIARFKFTPY